MDLSNTDSADDRPEQSNDDTDAAAFIAHEEQTVDQVVASLREQAVYGRERLQTENARARTLTARMVATRRVEDRAMMASDEAVSHALKDKKQAELEGIHKLIEKPYFARIILEEEADGKNKTIEYKLGTAANPDCRIIDWRKAPISKLYYEYREGDEYSEEILGRERNGRVALRNTVDIEKSKLRRISCRFGNFALQGDKWVSTGQAVRSRSASSSGELPGIVSLITADQFKTITEEADTAILIQGIAGSGKTTVALHRLAWLLHENNSDLKPEECVVIVLSNALKKYVSNTLPSLGISGVKVQIFSEWCRETVAKFAPQFFRTSGDPRRPVDPPPASIERVKRSIAVLNTLEKSAERERRMIIDEISLGLDWDEIPQDVRRSFDGSVKANSSLDEMLKELSQKIREIMADPRSSGSGSLYAALCLVEERQKGLLSLDQQLLDVLSDTDAILANDETRLLDGDLIRRAYERTERNFRESLIDPADEALLVRLYELKCGKPVAAGRREAGWRHIVVDEVQDMSPIELACIVAAVPDPRFLTLVGDISQKIDDSSGFPGWDKLREHWGFKDSMSKFVGLTVSHRSTLPIMRLAEHIQGRVLATSGRQGRVPIWFKCNSEAKGINSVIKWLGIALEKYPDALTAVVCQDEKEARLVLTLLQPSFGGAIRIGDSNTFSFEQGIVVTDLRQVKGLEFFNVVLWNPNARSYPNDEYTRNRLYVAVTRAEENLCIVTWNKPSELLPPHNSPLVRGIKVDEEEEG